MAWRTVASLGTRVFWDVELHDAPRDHSTLSETWRSTKLKRTIILEGDLHEIQD